MTEQEILEGNKLIALFMGDGYWQIWSIRGYKPYYADEFKTKEEVELKIATADNGNGILYMKGSCEPKFITKKYHTSWDWLMPVVKKVGDLTENKNLELWGRIAYSLQAVDMNWIFRNVIDYIKWYNQQTPAKQFIDKVNEREPGTFPSMSEDIQNSNASNLPLGHSGE